MVNMFLLKVCAHFITNSYYFVSLANLYFGSNRFFAHVLEEYFYALFIKIKNTQYIEPFNYNYMI